MENLSIRLKEREIRFIEDWSKNREIDKSTAARELIEYGKIYLILKIYKDGKISLEKTAKELGLPISETIDLLAEFGINAPITSEDYLKGYNYERKKALYLNNNIL